MIKPLYQSAVALAALSLLTGCIDDSYDLSDVDTTTRVNINDLVLPVNIDPVTLGDVISIDPDSKIQTVSIGGKEFYALVQKGDFNSEPVAISGVAARQPSIRVTRRLSVFLTQDSLYPGGIQEKPTYSQ